MILLAAVTVVTVVLAILLVRGLWFADDYDEPDWWPDFEREFKEYVQDEKGGSAASR